MLTSKGIISNILAENVVQPLLVSTSALELATETVALILRIDDIQVSAGYGYRSA
jgi:T-complex protein 1 subunit delta